MFSLFPRLDEAMINRLQTNGEIVWLNGGATLPIDKLGAKDFSIVIEGAIDAFIVRGNCRTHLAKLGRGQFTGDITLLTGHKADAIGYEWGRTRVIRILHKEVRNILVLQPDIGAFITKALIYRKILFSS